MKSRANNKGRDGGASGAFQPKLPFLAGEGRGEGSLSADPRSEDPPVITTHHSRTRSQAPSSMKLRGVRTHNLKAIDLDLPLKRLIVVTGPSGAGKSSLALDTLYAEGHRRYVETFSPYARQFLATARQARRRADLPESRRRSPWACATDPPLASQHRRHHHRDSPHARLALRPCRPGCLPPVRQARRPGLARESVSRAIEATGPRARVTRSAFRSKSAPKPIRRHCSPRCAPAGSHACGSTAQTIDAREPRPRPARSMASVEVIVDRLVRGSDVPTAAPTRSKRPSTKGSADAG